tara:strand:+ start:4950 stop:5594 length:645 start_codon:yes stop_codon:yes gene_type:complete
MKVIKQILLFNLFFFITIGLQSQTSIKAKILLDEVSLQMNNYKNYEFNFKYVLENSKENIKQETKGQIIVMSEKYKISTIDIIQLFNGKKLYTIVPENEEVLITNPDQTNDFISNPTKLVKLYESGYDFYWDISQNIGGNNIQYIKLIPTEESLDVIYILLGINMKTKNIYKLIEIGKQRTTTTLTIESLNINNDIPPSFFEFNEADYPGFYIN